MQPNAFAEDATIEDILDKLDNPEEYVRIVLSNLSSCRKAHGNASVQIGITGEGKPPTHRVTYTDVNGEEETFGAFDGDSPLEGVSLQAQVWSSTSITFKEVQMLLGQLRRFDRRKTPREAH